MITPFTSSQDIQDVISDPIVVDIDGKDANEAMANQWSFSITEEQAKELSVQTILNFMNDIIDAREQAILKQFGGMHPMFFYCWHDEMAAQLRFSLVSAEKRLPFSSEINIEQELSKIIESFLSSRYHNGISFKDLVDITLITDEQSTEPERPLEPLQVWYIKLPRKMP